MSTHFLRFFASSLQGWIDATAAERFFREGGSFTRMTPCHTEHGFSIATFFRDKIAKGMPFGGGLLTNGSFIHDGSFIHVRILLPIQWDVKLFVFIIPDSSNWQTSAVGIV